MKIIDLNDSYKDIYFHCLEDWSPDIKEAGNHKACWYEKMKKQDLKVKLAINDQDQAIGMIQYQPIEHTFVTGQNLYMIYCIWVHGHKQGIGNQQKKGTGKALLAAAEQDAQAQGAKGIAAWGISLPFWMKASWFKKQGYIQADKDGMAILLVKPFINDIQMPKWLKQKQKPQKIPGKVTVTVFKNGWCPAQNIHYERAKRACKEIKGPIIFQEIDTLNKKNFLKWGITDALFIDDKNINNGPPLSYQKIKKKIQKKVIQCKYPGIKGWISSIFT